MTTTEAVEALTTGQVAEAVNERLAVMGKPRVSFARVEYALRQYQVKPIGRAGHAKLWGESAIGRAIEILGKIAERRVMV